MRMNLAKLVLVTLLAVPSVTIAARSECKKVGTRDIERRSITSTQIKDGAVSTEDLSDGTVNGQHVEEFTTVTPFVLAAGESRDLFDSGDLRLEAKCYGLDGYDTAAVVIQNVTEGALLYGADETTNLTSATPDSSRELQRAAALTGIAALDYSTRSAVVGADGAFLKSGLFIGVNLRNTPGCHFGGMVHYKPAS